jgi:VacB/RNase II family 3'-5' exoribonuclease
MNPPNRPGKSVLQQIARRAMVERGLQPDFTPAAQAELSALKEEPWNGADGIQDLRGLLWCSIDNDDSRDLDQLSVSAPAEGAAVNILVAVADVDSLVRRGSAIDAHARFNTTSVYTPAEIFPMLPLELSTDRTSLGQDRERLAIITEMTIQPDGTVSGSKVYRGRVFNRAKLTYAEVGAWLDGKGPVPPAVARVDGMDAQIRIQDRAAQAMKALRYRHGALALKTIEAQVVFDGDLLKDLRQEEKNRAKELIEDFMIAANGVTATFLENRGLPTMRRVLRTPERWDRIVVVAAAQGTTLPALPDARALQQFLMKKLAEDPLRFPDLSLSVIKMLGSGEYAVNQPGKPPEGHFGLAVRAYTHSTAPNRRFPDVVTQRMLKAVLEGQAPPYSVPELEALARHCTDQENNASKVERQVRKSAAAMVLESRLGEVFDALVTGVSDKGTWVRTLRPPVEGMVAKGSAGLQVGEAVRVRLLRTDVNRGFIDFEKLS